MAKATSVKIGGVNFQCVHLSSTDFSDRAAIYVVLCVGKEGSWTVLDVGQSGEVGSRIDSHDRGGCWQRNCSSGNIWVCVHAMPADRYTKKDRLELERKLREQYNPPCGER